MSKFIDKYYPLDTFDKTKETLRLLGESVGGEQLEIKLPKADS